MPKSIDAKESKVIRVSYTELGGYHEVNEYGQRSGYGYEYLQQIASYTNWQYEYVGYEKSWLDQEVMLANGEIDLIDFVVKTPEREAAFAFSRESIGSESTLLTVRIDDDRFDGKDYASYDGIKIGMILKSRNNDRFALFAEEHDITYQSVYYERLSEMKDALARGEVDALVTTSMLIGADEKIVEQFDLTFFYIMVRKEDTALLQEINDALVALKNDKPYLSNTLYHKYYVTQYGLPLHLTQEEEAYIQALQETPITVAVNPDQYPYSYVEDNIGKGIDIDVINEIANRTGLIFSFILCESREQYMRMLENNEAAIFVNKKHDYNLAEAADYRLTEPYTSITLSQVTLKNKMDEIKTVAAVIGATITADYLETKYLEENITYFNSIAEATDIIKEGKADVLILSTEMAQEVLYADYKNILQSNIIPNYEVELGFAIADGSNTILAAIFNKAILSIAEEDINAIRESYDNYFSTQITLMAYVYNHPIEVIIIIICIIIIILLGIFKFTSYHQKALQQIAYYDELTGHLSFQKFTIETKRLLANAMPREYAIVSLDINDFKYINQSYGFDKGNEVLKLVGDGLRRYIKTNVLITRSSGDNFVLLVRYDALNTYYDEAIKNLSKVENECSLLIGNNYKPIFNVGIYIITNPTGEISGMIDCANEVKKIDKGFYRTSVKTYTQEMAKKLFKKREITSKMEQAIYDREFVPFVQPKYSFATEKIIGGELLVRWISKDKGIMYPDEFIPVFEKNGFIQKLDMYMFEVACELSKEFLNTGKDTAISVNLSRMTLMREGIMDDIQELIERSNAQLDEIEIEVTETIFSEDQQNVLKNVQCLRSMGFKIAIDDFGSGYSSFKVLKDMDVDVIKIDKDFMSANELNADKGWKIVRRIIELAQALDLCTVAEGVETKEQVDKLSKWGCDIAQGYYYSRPIPVRDFAELLESHNQGKYLRLKARS